MCIWAGTQNKWGNIEGCDGCIIIESLRAVICIHQDNWLREHKLYVWNLSCVVYEFVSILSAYYAGNGGRSGFYANLGLINGEIMTILYELEHWRLFRTEIHDLSKIMSPKLFVLHYKPRDTVPSRKLLSLCNFILIRLQTFYVAKVL